MGDRGVQEGPEGVSGDQMPALGALGEPQKLSGALGDPARPLKRFPLYSLKP